MTTLQPELERPATMEMSLLNASRWIVSLLNSGPIAMLQAFKLLIPKTHHHEQCMTLRLV